MMRSYDIDGVLSIGVRPEKPCIIVSGRLVDFMPQTIIQMKELGIDSDIPIYLRPSGPPADRVCAAIWKARIIDSACVEMHYEDDDLQAGIISRMCPLVKIFKVG